MVVVLIVAGGAAWEPRALALLDQRPEVVVLKRCVDVDDLLATAAAGQAEAAVVGLDAAGFDLAAVDLLRRYDVRPIAVAPHDRLEAARARAARIGVPTVLADDAIGDLAGLLLAEEPPPTAADRPSSTEASVGSAPATASAAGRVFAVWGAAGAPGRTTLAIGLAGALARRGPVTLVDCDPYGGSVAQVLGVLDEVSGLLAAARLAGAGELTARYPSVPRSVDGVLEVVTGLPRPDRWAEVRAGTVETLVEVAVGRGPVVVDTGFSLERSVGGVGARPGRNQLTLAALAVADEVLVVGTADPVGLSRLAHALVVLRETEAEVPVRVVVNRMRPSLGWSEREVTELVAGFARPVGLHFLPEDRPTVDQALVSGRSLQETASHSPLVVALDRLADELLPCPVEAGRWWRRRPPSARPRTPRPRTTGRGRRR